MVRYHKLQAAVRFSQSCGLFYHFRHFSAYIFCGLGSENIAYGYTDAAHIGKLFQFLCDVCHPAVFIDLDKPSAYVQAGGIYGSAVSEKADICGSAAYIKVCNSFSCFLRKSCCA